MAACCLSNFAGGGGGAVFATTSRVTTGAGGLAAAGRPAPSTDCLVGGIGGVAGTTRALTISLWFTPTTFFFPDMPPGKFLVGREVYPPRAYLCLHRTLRSTSIFFYT